MINDHNVKMKCPECGHEFNNDDVHDYREALQKDIESKMQKEYDAKVSSMQNAVNQKDDEIAILNFRTKF